MANRKICGDFKTAKGKIGLHCICSGPIAALNDFHRQLQRHHGIGAEEYSILRLYEPYQDASGRWIDSEFDIPKGPNPDVKSPHRRGKDKTSAMFSDDELNRCDTKKRL